MAKKSQTLPAPPVEEKEDIPLDTMGIDMESLIQEHRLAQDYTDQYTRDFVQLDNLVDGVPIIKEDGTPFVGDTTLAGLVRSIPRQSLKQLPVLSAVVNGTKNSIQALICTFLLKKTAFNEDTFGKGLLSTLQIGAEQALTHGYAPFLVSSGLMYEDFGTTMRLLHYSDTSLEPGVSDSNESGFHFVTAHLTKGAAKRLFKSASGRQKTSWNLPALEELLEQDPQAKDYTRYQSDPQKASAGQDQGKAYEFITRYETRGEGSSVTFCPALPEAPLRVTKGKSKFGYPRVQYLVIDPGALNPFGVSRVRLASPNQNFMNIYLGNIASMLLINSAPPVFKRGVFLKPTPLKRNASWESLDPNAEISLKVMDNGALAQFPAMAQQFAGQIQNLMGGQSSTVNAQDKGAAFGKTAPGVEAGQTALGIETAQVTHIMENFLRQYGIVALDVILSESSGEKELIVDDDTKNAINEVDEQSFVPTPEKPTYIPLIGANNVIKIVWKDLYDAVKEWSVEVDVSLSPDELKDKKRADLQDMLVVLAQNSKDIPGAAEKVQEITNLLLEDKAPLLKPLGQTGTPGDGSAPAGQDMGPKVVETADLVKMFMAVTDPNVQNAILGLMHLPSQHTPPVATTQLIQANKASQPAEPTPPPPPAPPAPTILPAPNGPTMHLHIKQ